MNQTQKHQEEAPQIQLVFERSAEDTNRWRQGIPENRNINAENDSGRRHGNQDNRSRYIAFKKARKHIKSIAAKFCENHKHSLFVFMCVFAIVTFSRFIAGSVKLSSDCDIERRVAVYLFVKAWFAVFFWIALIVWYLKDIVGKALDNPFVEAYLVIELLFSLCWLFVGTAWIWGNFNNINSQCPERIHNWNGHFINFALFLTVVDYIGLVVFLFYSGYAICEKPEETEVVNL